MPNIFDEPLKIIREELHKHINEKHLTEEQFERLLDTYFYIQKEKLEMELKQKEQRRKIEDYWQSPLGTKFDKDFSRS